jgi:O-antigen/teichoic acid export membrane protein
MLIPPYGMIGAAVATLTAFLIVDTILLLLTWREVGILPYNSNFAGILPPIILSSGGVYVTQRALQPRLFGSIILAVIMGLTYLLLLYKLDGIQKRDLNLAKKIYNAQI